MAPAVALLGDKLKMPRMIVLSPHQTGSMTPVTLMSYDEVGSVQMDIHFFQAVFESRDTGAEIEASMRYVVDNELDPG